MLNQVIAHEWYVITSSLILGAVVGYGVSWLIRRIIVKARIEELARGALKDALEEIESLRFEVSRLKADKDILKERNHKRRVQAVEARHRIMRTIEVLSDEELGPDDAGEVWEG